jgi:hypothetical protein
MPISDKYRVIFIHIPKCGGIGIWNGLDIVPCRCNLISITSMPIYQHMLPKQLKGRYIGEARWNSYKKITIIREPYDRFISDYAWLRTYEQFSKYTIDEFIYLRERVVNNNRYNENMYYDHFYPMHYYFEDIEYDYVLRFENLDEELKKIKKIFNIEKPFLKTNASNRTGIILNKKQKGRIYNLYKEDFKQFGYKP